jgi:cation diffusion facilitator CzcD-associated flavoprotein CzcO
MEVRSTDAVVVGAGFAGLYMLHRLRGLGLATTVFETGAGVGGTWYWNRYPGARCDIDSLEYSYQFSEALQQEWAWTERYATQPEILRYANHVAQRFDLLRDIRFETRVVSARFDDETLRWRIETDRGEVVSARWCILATGCLSSANLPAIPGREAFAGRAYHTGRWPHDGVDFTGQRVGVIGTGSSAIQSIPLIAEQASQLFVFQRTPTYSVPAHNRPLDPETVREIKADYRGFRARNAEQAFGFGSRLARPPEGALALDEAARERLYEERWREGGLPFLSTFADLMLDPAANETAAEFIRKKIRSLVRDPAVAERLLPTQVVGCKRLCVDTRYYATYNRANVTLVDLREEPIEAIDATGLATSARHYDLDAIVYATGFDAMTGALERIDVRGRAGRPLRQKWSAGPRTYLGLATEGFPNLFLITGPGSPSVLSNMIPSIEQHVDWIADCIAHVRARGAAAIEATAEAEDAWVEHVNAVGGFTLFPSCSSWYLGANVPGKPRVFMPYVGFPAYVAKCRDVVARGYEGFVLDRLGDAGTFAREVER